MQSKFAFTKVATVLYNDVLSEISSILLLLGKLRIGNAAVTMAQPCFLYPNLFTACTLFKYQIGEGCILEEVAT